MSNSATRLITLIMLLQRQPKQTATQLAQVLDVSVRTVHWMVLDHRDTVPTSVGW